MKDLQDLFSPNPSTIPGLTVTTGGQFVLQLLETAFFAAGFMAFFYMVWGAFQYITASGKKDELQKARSKITYAIIGLMVVLLAYFIMRYAAASEIFMPKGPGGVKGWLPF